MNIHAVTVSRFLHTQVNNMLLILLSIKILQFVKVHIPTWFSIYLFKSGCERTKKIVLGISLHLPII